MNLNKMIKCKRCGMEVEDTYWEKEQHYWNHAEVNASPMGAHRNSASVKRDMGLWGNAYNKSARLAEKALALTKQAMELFEATNLRLAKEAEVKKKK